jgi:hypothetical protein
MAYRLGEIGKPSRNPLQETRSAVTKHEDYPCHYYAAAIAIRETNTPMKQLHFDRPGGEFFRENSQSLKPF